MPRDSENTVKVDGLMLVARSAKALAVTTDIRDETRAHPRLQKPEAWIALSLVEETNLVNIGDVGFIKLPKWLADKNEWVYEEV